MVPVDSGGHYTAKSDYLGPNSRNAIASPTAEKRVLAGNYSLYTTN